MSVSKADEARNRKRRVHAVLTALRRKGQATKTELATDCGMSRPTVAGILDELQSSGIVTTLETSPAGGRPAQAYGFAPKAGMALAIDIWHDLVTIAAAAMDGSVVAATTLPLTPASRQARLAQVLRHVTAFLHPLRRRHGKVLSVACSTTGTVDADGTIVRSHLVPQWAGFPLRRVLTEQLGCPVRVENDINAAAYGEYSARAAAGTIGTRDDVLYLSVAGGFLTGLILGGRIHRGHTSNAGEIADIVGGLQFEDPDAGQGKWAPQAVTAVGLMCLVVDPRVIVVSAPHGTAEDVIPELTGRLNHLRPADAPPLCLEASSFGSAAACIGALALAMEDADATVVQTPPETPPLLRNLELLVNAHQEGQRTLMTQPARDAASGLRVGVIGVGARAPLALHAEQTRIPARIVAACEPHPLARERVRDRLQRDPDSITITSTVAELIDVGIDVAFVTSPDDTHAEITCELLEAGVAVYLEKPLAIHLDDATRILETAHRTGTKLYLGHNMRHMNVVRRMRDLIREGRIGEVKAIWCRHFVGSGGDFYFKDWHATREHGTGLLLQKAAHDIDVMHWLAASHTNEVVGMGDLMVYDQVTDRADHGNELMGDWYSLDNWPPLSQRGLNEVIDVEDLSMVLMRMESGVLASYQQCHFTPDYWRNYTVIGTEGRIENFGDGEGGVIKLWNRRTTYSPDGDEQFPILGDAHGHSDADKLIVDEFLRFVAHGARTDTSPLGAWYSVAAGIQATESLRAGSTPRKVPGLPPELVEYFDNNQTK